MCVFLPCFSPGFVAHLFYRCRRITQVELNNKSYIRERGVGQALFALKEEQGKSFYVNARAIPLCPMTAKVVPRNLLSKVVPGGGKT